MGAAIVYIGTTRGQSGPPSAGRPIFPSGASRAHIGGGLLTLEDT